MSKDYYEILGVGREANDDEIKKAFRRLAHQHHPDKNGGDDVKFKEANEAYQVLSDKQKRAQYDQVGHNAFKQGGAGGFGGGGFNWQDFGGQAGFDGSNFDFGDLGDVFGDFFGMGGRQSPRHARGADIEVGMIIDFAESIFGVKKELVLSKQKVCDHCKGNMAEPGTKIVGCTTCQGSGQVAQMRRTVFGQIQSATTCPNCHGQGKIPEKPCHECKGVGVVRGRETVEVSVPAGIDDGSRLRLTGQGEAAPHNGTPGDLYIAITVRPHKKVRRVDFDLLMECPVNFTQAALGDTVSLETLDGKMDVKIPAGIQSGRVLRLKQLGAPYLRRAGRGDLLVTIQVITPEHLSKSQRKILEQLREEGM